MHASGGPSGVTGLFFEGSFFLANFIVLQRRGLWEFLVVDKMEL